MPTMTPARSTAAPAPGPACADDPDLMFPLVESERAWRPTPGEAAAQAVCARCPVLARCRRETLAGEPAPYGVAGGLTVADRRAIRASRRGLDRSPTSRGRRGSGGRGAGSCSRTCSPTRPVRGPGDRDRAGDGGSRPLRARRRSGEGPRAGPRAPPGDRIAVGGRTGGDGPARVREEGVPGRPDAGRELHPARALARPARGRASAGARRSRGRHRPAHPPGRGGRGYAPRHPGSSSGARRERPRPGERGHGRGRGVLAVRALPLPADPQLGPRAPRRSGS